MKVAVKSSGKKVTPGKFYPLGATPTPDGVNFALYSENAEEVYLLLFDRADGNPTDVIRVENCTRFIWHCFVHGARPGQLYGYKVVGPYEPEKGYRFNHHKLLIDPYAKAITDKVRNIDNLLYGYQPGHSDKDKSFDKRENMHIVPKAIVVDDAAFDWQGDAPPGHPMERLLIYEAHLKGFTAHPSSGVPESMRGTYLGFIEKIPYLKELGVNAAEFLPVQEFYHEDFLIARGLKNYWGYNTICFNAPEVSYSSQRTPGCQVHEFKALVRELHKADIEVILDVVYNHTAEGDEMGPTVNFKGIDNSIYYMLDGNMWEQFRYYKNYSGCGNTMNLAERSVIRFVMDSLRYWVQEMHVDGFRFDLASVLGRKGEFFRRSAAFFDAISQDPLLNRVKLIAEPWDLGTNQVGNFPVDWSEWNGKFRDTVRQFNRGDQGQIKDLGWRLTGSADLYADDGRSAYNSINFVTSHDGFTMYDLVSYERKHNEANKDNNRDGAEENYSTNCGVEGPTDDPDIIALRKRLLKNFACILFLSSGTPMMLMGDEILRTQRGNNNAYCQDNEISWFDWSLVKMNNDNLSFTKRLIRFAASYPILQKKRFFTGTEFGSSGVPDIMWFDPELRVPRWEDPQARTLCYMLNGGTEPPYNRLHFFYVALNADQTPVTVALPRPVHPIQWFRAIDTSLPPGEEVVEPKKEVRLADQDRYVVSERTVAVLIGR